MKKRTFPQKMTIVDVSGHPKHSPGNKDTLEYGGIELKFRTFVPFRFSIYQSYIFHIVLCFMYLSNLLFWYQILTIIMFSTIQI